MTRTRGLVLAVFLALALLASAACRTNSQHPSESIVAIALDQSSGTSAANRCDEVASRVERLLVDRTHRSFRFMAFGTGGIANDEPSILIDREVERPRLANHSAADRAAKLAEITESIRAECNRKLRRVSRSAIVSAVTRAGQALSAACDRAIREGKLCQPFLYLHSDLRENVDRTVVAAFKRRDTASLRAVEAKRIDFPTNITIAVCSTAVSTDSDRGAPSSAWIEEVWRVLLGPNAPKYFEPSCPTSKAAREGASR